MVFSSVIFLFFFLPLFLLLYFFFPRIRNDVLLVASLIFYGWGELAFFPVLLSIIGINYVVALKFTKANSRKFWLYAGILANLVALGCFKYGSFFDANLFALLGVHLPGVDKLTRIPLGISFFTFQAMSYLIDVYRGESPPERRIKTVALYIIMFPQLVAGPIVRFTQVCTELHDRTHCLDDVARGARIFILGLASKVLIANIVAVPADSIFGLAQGQMGPALAWFGALCYTMQIYFDFAGYSWMAIGLGAMMGFRFPQNFDFPYSSQSITEFWRRWHISLSTFFRDYLYIPMGGSRMGTARTYRNLVIVFLLCGLWHGAKWTFVAWGIYHGCFLVAERMFQGKSFGLPWPFRRVYALLVVMCGWVLFRSDSLPVAVNYYKSLFGGFVGTTPMMTAIEFLSPTMVITLFVGILLSGFCGIPQLGYSAFSKNGKRSSDVPLHPAFRLFRSAGIAVLLLLCMCAIASGTHNPFIYFNF